MKKKINMDILKQSDALTEDRIAEQFPAKWDMAGSLTFKASIEMRGIDRKGMTKDVSTVIYDAFDVNIKSFVMTTDDGIFNCRIELLVTDNVITERIIKKLYAINGMQSVHRM